ncbi:MAG: hypothetical protein M1817_001611 [Caeruleum heppii]|nr:MAG: hypothetical protein M1817_001611 [Caeruleum heppii]
MASESASDSGFSSPLSSLASQSPSPPSAYPSPSSSQELSLDPTPAKSSVASRDAVDGDGPPPTKKRKIPEPKRRTTEYLDLRHLPRISQDPSNPQTLPHVAHLDLLLNTLRKKRKIVVIAGAGISVSAGIPDFRSSTGLFSTLRDQHKLKASGKHLFDASVYKTDASTSSFHDMVRSLSQLVTAAQPTAFHHLLARLAQEGRLLRLYSQNVDGIDTALPPLATKVPLSSKGPWPQTIQLHGGLEKMVCQKCNHLSDFQSALFDGPQPPSCRECEALDSVRTNIAGKRSHGVGKLRPRIVLYNEYNPDEEAIGAITHADLRSRPDAVIVVGTSLKVPGVRRIVREMCGVVRSRRGGVAIWINNAPEPVGREFENCWDLVVKGDCDQVAERVGLRRWDDDSVEPYQELDDKEWARVKAEHPELDVIVGTPMKKQGAQLVQGVLTPIASPRFKMSGMDLSKAPKMGHFDTSSASLGNCKHVGGKGVTGSGPGRPRKALPKAAPRRKEANKVKALPGNRKMNDMLKVSKSVAGYTSKPAARVKGDSFARATHHTITLSPPDPDQDSSSDDLSLPSALLSERSFSTPLCTARDKSQAADHAQERREVEVTASVQARAETVSPKGRLPDNLAKLMN